MEQAFFYVHDLDPKAFELFGMAFHWYWINYLFGYLFVYFGGANYLESIGESEEVYFFQRTCFIAWLGLFIGSRIVYVLFYNLDLFLNNPNLIYRFWLGGMSFHGAVLGVILAILIGSQFKLSKMFLYLDAIALWAPIGLGLGRIGNFINGELAGRVTDVSWAVIFPRLYDNNPRHPSQLYEALGEGLFLFLFLIFIKSRYPQKRGVLGAGFLIGYGVIRFFIEFFRAPDPQIGYLLSYFTMGQLFCGGMILFGIFYLKVSQRFQN